MASTNTSTDLQKLYLAYFARPADALGLQYWQGVVTAAHGSTAGVAKAFASSSEYHAATAGLDANQLVTAAYQNLFGHAPDAAGLAYWASGLTKGTSTIDAIVTEIGAGAQGTDLTAFHNKVTLASAFTGELDTAPEILAYNGVRANAAATLFIQGVADDATLAAALVPATLKASVAAILFPSGSPQAAASADHAHGAEAAVTLVGLPHAGAADIALA